VTKNNQNCPSTATNCPARKRGGRSEFREALDTECARAYDQLPVHEDTYRQALLTIREILVDGCDQCVRNAVIWLANDMKWPPSRSHQLILVDELIGRSLERGARVH
jgi:hypothetical protein